jgi:hypothetical protein
MLDIMTSLIPTLAILGHPNAGKSSVVATLTENDRIEIDKRAGTTTCADDYPVIIDGRTVIRFIDTPGFQNPTDILDWFQRHAEESDLATAFVAAHRDDPLFSHDCALLEPVACGGGVILVIDGSKRIKASDRIEIELLRLTGRPRMAILNNLTNTDTYLPAWQDILGRAFNSVREFNAHRATYDERLKLLHALKSIDQRWEPSLEDTIQAFQQDWERRIDQTVTIILDLFKQALTFRVSRVVLISQLQHDADRQQVSRTLEHDFQNGLRDLEQAARAAVRDHFHHQVWDLPLESLLRQDLFSDEVSQAFGIGVRKRMLTGAAIGASTGVGIDLSLAGGSLGIGMLLGATGGLLGAFSGAALAKFDIQRTLGVERFSLGPVTNPNFPFILLDRILLYCLYAMNWAHGRQAADETAPNRVPDRLPRQKYGFAEELSSEHQRLLTQFFVAVRKGRDNKYETDCRHILKTILYRFSNSDIVERSL